MENNKVIEKVRKCLELANNNPNEHEAQSAALQAQKLLAKYGISLEDVEAFNDNEREIGQEGVLYNSLVKGVVRAWKYELAHIVADNFRCRFMLMGGKKGVYFYGYKEDTKVAADVYRYLFQTGDRLANRVVYRVLREYHKNGEKSETSGLYNNWVEGYMEGIKSALSAQCTELALVISKEVNEAFEEKTASFKRVNTGMRAYYKNDEFYNNGFQAGRDTIGSKRLDKVV